LIAPETKHWHNWQNEAAALIARHLRELENPPA
jgi:hypothetical protein